MRLVFLFYFNVTVSTCKSAWYLLYHLQVGPVFTLKLVSPHAIRSSIYSKLTVSLPACPPTQCLSITLESPQRDSALQAKGVWYSSLQQCCPTFTMALQRETGEPMQHRIVQFSRALHIQNHYCLQESNGVGQHGKGTSVDHKLASNVEIFNSGQE